VQVVFTHYYYSVIPRLSNKIIWSANWRTSHRRRVKIVGSICLYYAG
jgi:hypothetical protein